MVAKVPDANGVAFGPGPNRKLYVLSYGNGNITEITLEGNVQKSQQLFVKLPKGSADGIAFDKLGNLYATAGALWKVTPDKVTTMVSPMGGANVDFGVGALSCKLVLWASNPAKQQEIDVEGMDVPWHRP
jgi:sugar lactone lactonase YvrE